MTVEQKQNFFSKPINLYYMLIFSSLGLSLLGLVMVFSASSIHSLETKGTTFAIVLRQFIFLLISIPMAWVLSRFSLNRWKGIARLGVVVSFGLLAIVQVIGKSVNGNHNWISLGFVDVQPSEIAKFLMILWAGYVLAKRERMGEIQGNVIKLIAPAYFVCMVLVMVGSDLGTASVFGFVLAGLLWVSGVRLSVFTGIMALGFAGIGALILSAPYRMARFSVFLNPFAEDQYKNIGWQPAHSLLGLASGGLFGVGLGASRQKWGNLPEAHTDFIFPILGEELGLPFTLGVVAVFLVITLLGGYIACHAPDLTAMTLGIGLTALVAMQAVANLAVVTGLLPPKGVGLPFISYGGSNLVLCLAAVGMLVALHRQAHYREEARSRRLVGGRK